jgi:uncharacterized protein YjbI with pentapeptide repeats
MFFIKTKFLSEADFSDVNFSRTIFDNVIFKRAEEVLFEVENLSEVSFRNTDISRVRFGENVVWGMDDIYKVADENLIDKPSFLFLFNWNDDIQDDNERLLEFLNTRLGLAWTEGRIRVCERIYANELTLVAADGKRSLT